MENSWIYLMDKRRRLAGTRPRLYGQFPVQFKRRAAARLFPGSLKFGILYEFDIFLIMPGHFIIMERETFGDPADEEPETAEKYEELENPVNQGIGFSGHPDPFRIQVVSTVVNPFGIEHHEKYLARRHGKKPGDTDVVEQDPVKPFHRIHEGEEDFPGAHHDAQKFIVRNKDKSGEGEEADHTKADEGGQFSSHINPADHVHNKEDEEQGTDGSEKIGAQVIEGGILHTVQRMNQDIRKDENP
jgi:hypothetical protein